MRTFTPVWWHWYDRCRAEFVTGTKTFLTLLVLLSSLLVTKTSYSQYLQPNLNVKPGSLQPRSILIPKTSLLQLGACENISVVYDYDLDIEGFKTTYTWTITDNGLPNAISHWGFDLNACPPTIVQQFLAATDAYIKIGNGGWNPVNYVYGQDNSQSCETGAVLKFDMGLTRGTTYMFKLEVDGWWSDGITDVYFKYGNQCCTKEITNEDDCLERICPPSLCNINKNTTNNCPGATNTYSAPANMDSYLWTVSGNASISGANNTRNITVVSGSTCGQYTLTLQVSKFGCTRQCQEVIAVVDNTKPVLSAAPANATVQCNAVPAAATLTATDNCDQNVTVSYQETRTNGNCPNAYTLTRTWTATDDCGNEAVATQVITVIDNTKPVLSGVPADATVQCNNIPAAPTVTATDNCDTEVAVVYAESTTPGNCPNAYTITRTWTATDDCNNQTVATQVITVIDNTKPVLSAAPANATVQCNAVPAAATLTATDNCDQNVTVSYQETRTNGNCPNAYTLTRTWTATDDCGNEAVATQVITVIDNTKPVLSGVPANIQIQCSSSIPVAASVTATDNCDTEVPVAFSETTTPGACANAYTITRTWTATDDCGNSISGTQVITVVDTEAPSFTFVPAAVQVQCNAIPSVGAPTATDNCDTNVDITYLGQQSTPGNCAGAYTLTRTWRATDNCGNSTTATQVITVIDNTKPVLSGVPANTTVQCDEVPAPATPTATDNCDTNVDISLNETTTPGACANAYTITRTWTATDDCGNSISGTQVITVVDTEAPSFTFVPAAVQVQCNAIPSVGAPTATDNCDTNVDITYLGQQSTPGNCPDAYTLTRTWRATDNCNNSITATQVITVVDNQAPTFTFVPAAIQVQCDEVPTAIGTPTAVDNCDANVTITYLGQQITPGNCPGAYTITRTWRATDNCNNSTEASQVITVQDTEAPVLSADPADVQVQCSATIPAPATLTATDNCDANVPVTFNETRTDGACANAYTLTRTWTATDDCGNIATVTQIITVVDTEAPALTGVPTNVTVQCDEVPAPATPTATDNCDTNVDIAYVQTMTAGSCANSYILTRKWTATDNCGNSTVRTQVITVVDTEAPVFSGVPANTTVQCNAIPSAATPSATDNCDTDVAITYEQTTTPGACANAYTLTRKWTATDNCGNATVATQVITVIDTQAPTFTLVPANVTVECDAVPVVGSATATDNCDASVDVVYVGESRINGNCPNNYILRRTWRATDNCGNATEATQEITVQDTKAPTYTLVVVGVVSCNPTQADILGAFKNPIASDNCTTTPIISGSLGTEQGTGCQRSIVMTWTISDACGNTATATQTLNFIRDEIAPQIVGNTPTSIQAECNTTFANLPWVAPTWTDNCGGPVTQVSVVTTPNQQQDACPGAAVYTRTWTVKDACGNQTTFTQTIMVPCCSACTYTQGFYGNFNGSACVGDEVPTKAGAIVIMQKALANGSFTFGNEANDRYWVLKPSDVANGKASNIFKMLPGGGTPQALGVYTTGVPSYDNTASWSVAPLQEKGPKAGQIKNSLLAQTVTLFFNLSNSSNLGDIPLTSDVLITADVECGSSTPIPGTNEEYPLPPAVVDFLNNNTAGYDNTVSGLFQLANDALGGNPNGLSYSAISEAVDAINNAFDECRVLVGYRSNRWTSTAAPAEKNRSEIASEALSSQLNVTASPNPFNDNVRFTIESTVSGQGSLEVYNLVGQKLQTVYQGYLTAGKGQTVEYKVPVANRTTLIYVLRVGGQQVTGKLLNVR